MACVEASLIVDLGHWEEGSDRKTGNGLAGEYLPSWAMASGLGHDHFAIAINYRRPHLILGGPSGNAVSMPLRCVVKFI